jgi:hypothetical protein
MPLYYDTTAPTAGNKNSITRTAAGTPGGQFGIRDFLLALNIQNPIRYPQLSTSVNGSPRGGEPFLDTMVGSGAIPQQNPLEVDGVFRYGSAIIMNLYKNQDPNAPVFLDIEDITTTPIFPTPPPGNNQYPTTPNSVTEQYGLLAKSDFAEYRKQATIKNLYLDATKQVDMADYISLQPIQAAQQLPSYDEAYGQLLGTGPVTTQAVDIVGSILNGQGVGLSAGNGNGIGLVPNFDIRSSLAGRVLGVAGVLNDTKLGIIGAEQLALSLANNAAFNTQQAILGKLNLEQNINAIFGSGEFEFPRPNYKITVSDDLLGKAVGTAERILGFTIPKSRLDDSGSIFFTESGAISNTDRANSMLTNTGKGQRKALSDQLKATLLGTSEYDNPDQTPFRSGYAPFYKGGGTRDFLVNGAQPKLYAFNGNEPGEIYNFINSVTKGNPIPEISYNREKMVEDAGFTSPRVTNVEFLPTRNGAVPILTDSVDAYGNSVSHIKKPTFSWAANTITGTSSDRPINSLPTAVGGGGDKKSLLGKTQQLFNSKGMKSIVSTKGDMSVLYGSQIETSVVNGGISKGSAVLKGLDRVTGKKTNMFNDTGQVSNVNNEAQETFCRSWTTYDRYDSLYKMIRTRGLNQTEGSGEQILTGATNRGWRLHNSERMSVLGKNGFPQIAPYKTDTLTRPSNGSLPKKYMFSIENLAWAGSAAVNLLPIEQGPGDLLTGKFGRIMWFPPYDIKFSETSSLSIESNLFIGRGEPLYTYNNTERTGNLSFKIIVDHPSIVNGFKGKDGPSDEFVTSWFAGCVDDTYFGDKLTQEEKDEGEKTKQRIIPKRETIKKVDAPGEILIHFPNDITKIETVLEWNYEDGSGKGYGTYNGEPQKDCATCTAVPSPNPELETFPTNPPPIYFEGEDGNLEIIGYFNSYVGKWPDSTNYSLNKPGLSSELSNKKLKVPPNQEFDTWNDEAYKDSLRVYLKDTCPQCVAEIEGYASSQGGGVTYRNQELSKARAESMKKWLLDNNIIEESRIVGAQKTGVKTGKKFPYNATTPVDSIGPKYDRHGKITFTNRAEDTFKETKTVITEPDPSNLNRQIKKRFYTEQDFFEELERTDSFVFDKFREKIRYFHPAFHSTTPEGLNSRLTFLLQCTRQGPTPSGTEPQNLAFGAPPVCILRIGDFYNTKIMMDSLNIDYEPLVWDLNPEGIGVQPMIANVTISFKYIGASSMYGPINKLQNALSFNYFANTEVYDPRADYIATVETIQNEKLIKNYPTDTKLQKRDTFGSNGASQETAYGLVPGLNPLNDSMGALVNKVPEYVAPAEDQTKTSEKDNTKQETTEKAAGQTSVTATDPPCSSDSLLIGFGTQSGDTTNPPLKVLNDVANNNANYLQFFINKKETNSKIEQIYNVTATITNKRDNKKYEWDKGETLSDNNFGQVPYTILFSETNPQIPQQTSTSDDGYSILIKLTGKLTGCTIEFNGSLLTNSSTEAANSLSQLTVDGVSLVDGTTEGGTLTFRIANNNNVVVSGNYKIKSKIVSADREEFYNIIIKDDSGNDFIYKAETKIFTYAFANTTPVCKGLDINKQYVLETILFDDSGTEFMLNKVNLDLKATTQTGPKITKFAYVEVIQTVSGTYAFQVSACQEGISKFENGANNQIISEADYETFVKKGIKIRLELAASKEKVFEKTVTWRSFSDSSTDDFFNNRRLFGLGLYLGDETKPSSDNPQIGLLAVEYNVIIYYEDKEIDKIVVNVNPSTPFKYFGDCGKQATTPPPTISKTDEGIFEDAMTLGKYELTNLQYDANNNLTGRFAILQGNNSLTKDHQAKFNLIDTFGETVELATFTINGTTDGSRGSGTFVTSITSYKGKNNIKDILLFGGSIDLNPNIELSVTIPEFTKINYAFSKYVLGISCPGEGYVRGSVLNKEDVDAIMEDPCENCYPDGTGNDTVVINGQQCPKGNTPSLPFTLPYVIKDSYDANNPKFTFSNTCDRLHAFQSTRVGDVSYNVGEMNTKVRGYLDTMYDAGVNPDITSVKVDVNGSVVNWEVTIDKSTDGKAWVGFSSRGSASNLPTAKLNFDGGGNTVGLLQNIKATFKSDASSVELKDVPSAQQDTIDKFIYKKSIGISESGGDCNFWQKFAKYTLPVTKPAK